jgi:hypothetical protein
MAFHTYEPVFGLAQKALIIRILRLHNQQCSLHRGMGAVVVQCFKFRRDQRAEVSFKMAGVDPRVNELQFQLCNRQRGVKIASRGLHCRGTGPTIDRMPEGQRSYAGTAL